MIDLFQIRVPMFSKKPILCGNWKMHKTIPEALEFLSQVPHDKTFYLAVPFTSLYPLAQKIQGSSILLGGQNIYPSAHGPFTGEISAPLLKDAGAHFVILGHSERRTLFQETNAFINQKVKRALTSNLDVIYCLGESLMDREKGNMHEVLEEQLKEGLKDMTTEDFKNIVIAYEPIWAIGTGKTATPQMAQEVHHFLRELIKKEWGSFVSENTPLLYGGSVTPETLPALLQEPDIDGALVGGASLNPESFKALLKALP